MKILLSIVFFTGCYFESGAQVTIIGNWHRVIPGVKRSMASKQLLPHDLQIFPDSTYHLQGDPPPENSVPGWHNDDRNGAVRIRDSVFTLIFDSTNLEGISYKILKLTKDKMLVRMLPNEGNIQFVRF